MNDVGNYDVVMLVLFLLKFANQPTRGREAGQEMMECCHNSYVCMLMSGQAAASYLTSRLSKGLLASLSNLSQATPSHLEVSVGSAFLRKWRWS